MNIFNDDFKSEYSPVFVPNAPIKDYSAYIRPQDDPIAIENGKKCVEEINADFVCDLEKNDVYAKANGGAPDLMCHVSTFYIINGIIYATYYASETCAAENPVNQEARLAVRPLDAKIDEPSKIFTVQKAGDTLSGRKITKVYDTVSAYTGGDIIFVLWTAQVENNYYRLYREFNIKTEKFGEIKVCRIKVGGVTNDFSTSGIISALAANKIPQKRTFEDIGIIQKFTLRTENGKIHYYTGAYSGYLTFIVKTADFITWEYVSAPDFINFSLWENSTYLRGDKAYYFTRQSDCSYGFLTVYDIVKNEWQTPVLIADCSSRADFFEYKGRLYLVNAPKNREGFAVTLIDENDISKSRPAVFADLKTSLFYPFVQIYKGKAYISYTVDRKHIRLSRFTVPQ